VTDANEQVNEVQRRVGTRTFEAGEARTVTITRTYDAALDDVWEACSSAERIPRWFLPVSGELRLGGRYALEGNASGTIESCDPPHGFTATWEYGGEVTWIELRLAAEGDERTRFELEHIAHVDDERWTQFGPGAVGLGWDLGLMGLAKHLATGATLDPRAAEAWSTSPEGVAFLTAGGNAWCEAAIADGDDSAAARAAADRTIAFYTGTTPPEG
jgi:uncharacterized protein YndB with AHSA1/START domain